MWCNTKKTTPKDFSRQNKIVEHVVLVVLSLRYRVVARRKTPRRRKRLDVNASKYYRKNVVPLRAPFRDSAKMGSSVFSFEPSMEKQKSMLESIREMNQFENGFDAVIVCCSTEHQATYWGERLMQTRGSACKKDALVYAVCEDWAKDGAGNGLGTLYAYSKAKQVGGNKRRKDLDQILKDGGSVGLYHTAGKGTRLAPLPGAENNNKPGVKLPSVVEVGGEQKNLTILEAVVRQTNRYAQERPGRVSVFWGDQIFIPSAGHNKSGTHHADILAVMGPMPNEKEWNEKGFSNYGLIAVNGENEATQVEKVSHATATELLTSFGSVKQVGPSLGSFSLRHEMLSLMLSEFERVSRRKPPSLIPIRTFGCR